mmetsp:Transcript_7841/g.23679  ORF Transcript_7841/g.23679 Transcript_7841/m.23679 type:complete len:203 (-) Transcript_7841:219-827(-)
MTLVVSSLQSTRFARESRIDRDTTADPTIAPTPCMVKTVATKAPLWEGKTSSSARSVAETEERGYSPPIPNPRMTKPTVKDSKSLFVLSCANGVNTIHRDPSNMTMLIAADVILLPTLSDKAAKMSMPNMMPTNSELDRSTRVDLLQLIASQSSLLDEELDALGNRLVHEDFSGQVISPPSFQHPGYAAFQMPCIWPVVKMK